MAATFSENVKLFVLMKMAAKMAFAARLQMQKLLIIGLWVINSCVAIQAQTVSVTVQPQITQAIEGFSVLDRTKYINICHNGNSFESSIGNAAIANRYVNELTINFGRSLNLVKGASTYSQNIIEDAKRPGFADIDYLRQNAKPTNGSTQSAAFKARFPLPSGTLMHDVHNTYPAFMPKEAFAGTTDSLPVNKVAAAEIAANLLQYGFTNWSRPLTFEPINEPTWQLLDKSKMLRNLADFHLQAYAKVKALNTPTMVGGPCSSTAWYYNNQYQGFKQLSDFIDATKGQLDFYSFHVYDFHRWDSVQNRLIGRITSGLPLEGIMDMVANYQIIKYNKLYPFVCTEHGGTLNIAEQKQAMQTHFLGNGSGFAYDMQAKSITDFLMVNSCISNTLVFMNRPHQVYKVVPFILLESFAWNPKYHASILVANNYTDRKNWFESAQIHFFNYFKNIQGRRVVSQCANPDIQQQAYVNGRVLQILLNNLSDSAITVQLNYPTDYLDSIRLRRLGRNSNYTPYFNEKKVTLPFGQLQLLGKESVVLFCTYRQDLQQESLWNQQTYFAPEIMRQLATSDVFNIAMPLTDSITDAFLRIGVGRGTGTDRHLQVWLNNTELTVPMEQCAAKLEDASGYGSTKIVQVPAALLRANNVVRMAFPDKKMGGIGTVALVVNSQKIVADSTLPLQLPSFTAQLKTSLTVAIAWQTTNETNFSHFEIEYSTDAKQFGFLARINGGSIDGKYLYQHQLNPITTQPYIYYRLKMISEGGISSYSEIKQVSVLPSANQSLFIIPVPASSAIKVKLQHIEANTKGLLQVYNQQGQMITQITPYTLEQTIDIAHLPSGTYQLVLWINKQGYSNQFIKQ